VSSKQLYRNNTKNALNIVEMIFFPLIASSKIKNEDLLLPASFLLEFNEVEVNIFSSEISDRENCIDRNLSHFSFVLRNYF